MTTLALTTAILVLWGSGLWYGYQLGKADERRRHHDLIGQATRLAMAVLRQDEHGKQGQDVALSGPYWMDDNGAAWRKEPRQ